MHECLYGGTKESLKINLLNMRYNKIFEHILSKFTLEDICKKIDDMLFFNV